MDIHCEVDNIQTPLCGSPRQTLTENDRLNTAPNKHTGDSLYKNEEKEK